MGHVQAAGGCFFWSHRQDVGITRGLKERQSAGHDEVGHEEASIDAYALGREEQQGTCGIEGEPHEHTGLVGKLADEDGSGECHTEIAAIKGYLNQ